MITRTLHRYGAVSAVACLAAFLAACGNPASPGEHLEAYGVQVSDGAEVLVRAHGTEVTGGLTVQAGQQRGPLTVRMLDRNGATMEPRQGYWLRVVSSSPTVARWHQSTEELFRGSLEGFVPGATQFEFCNMHGAVGGGHADGCQAVTVTVTAAS